MYGISLQDWGGGGMLPQEIRCSEIASEAIFGTRRQAYHIYTDVEDSQEHKVASEGKNLVRQKAVRAVDTSS